MGIEPTLPAWKAGVLPLYDTCKPGDIVSESSGKCKSIFCAWRKRMKENLQNHYKTLAKFVITIYNIKRQMECGNPYAAQRRILLSYFSMAPERSLLQQCHANKRNILGRGSKSL